MNRDTQIEFGTVSHGTLRNEDILPALIDVLVDLNDAAAGRALAEIDAIEESGDWDGDRPYWLLDRVIEQLQKYAPEFSYFGTHPGDGSDFGYWPDTDHIEVSIADGDAIAVSDLAEIPADYVGLVFIQNDHGNLTYGYVPADGPDFVTVWAIV